MVVKLEPHGTGLISTVLFPEETTVQLEPAMTTLCQSVLITLLTQAFHHAMMSLRLNQLAMTSVPVTKQLFTKMTNILLEQATASLVMIKSSRLRATSKHTDP